MTPLVNIANSDGFFFSIAISFHFAIGNTFSQLINLYEISDNEIFTLTWGKIMATSFINKVNITDAEHIQMRNKIIKIQNDVHV